MKQQTTVERRTIEHVDRRKNSRSGRRAKDPHARWGAAWLFVGYVGYLTYRSAQSVVRRLWRRQPT